MFPPIMIVILGTNNKEQLNNMEQLIRQQTYSNLKVMLFDDSLSTERLLLRRQILESSAEYVTFVDVRDQLFEVSIEKLYHAAALSNADIAMGNYSDFSDGQYYFYPWGDDWIVKSISTVEYIQKNATSNYQDSRLYASLYGKLYHRRLFENLSEWNLTQLNWRLALTANEVAYVNYPTYVYTPKTASVQSYFDESLTSFQELLKLAQKVEGFSIEQGRREYIQQLANYTEWLKNEGASKNAERTYNMLVTAENGIIPLVDLPTTDFTIISNNCVGGLIYKQMGLPYRTPFVGLFILPEDYYRLTKNIRYYMNQEIVFDDELYYFEKDNMYYPVGYLDDVTLHFLHYKTIEEARMKWNRRKRRMNWKNIYFKYDDKDGVTEELLHKVDELPYHNKIILVHKDYQLQNQYIVPGHEVGFIEVGIINYPIQTFDVLSWLKRGGNDLSGGDNG